MADLEARGVPSVFVATVEFEDGANAQARALGADPPAVYVAHPIQDRTDDEMRKLADDAAERVVKALLSDTDE
ncbi:MAG: hypothetical protein MJE66_17325 [Proteobacteria bacterium]|nr:hypothetical protein [Pseudomonadota bacterium]